jgi:hypothetical protein
MWSALVSLIDPKGGGGAVSTPDDNAPVTAATSVGNVAKDDENGSSSTLPCNESTLEVDYVKNPTPLYKKMQQEDWTAVAKFLDGGYCTYG